MQNGVAQNGVVQHAVADLALRSLAPRYEAYAGEVRALIDAALVVMRRSGTLDPRVGEIVREAGLSNQAFYRHFPDGKDELLATVLDDGLGRLVAYLERQMAKEHTPEGQVRRWVQGVLAQAGRPVAAAAIRPFVLDSLRLRVRFPESARRSDERLQAPLRDAIAELPGSDPERDAAAVHHLTMGRMHAHLVDGSAPSRRDVAHLVAFALGGIRRGA